jgi:hypothetical protein
LWHLFLVPATLELPLKGPKGEPVDFARAIVSHGVAELPPNRVDLAGRALETTPRVPRSARTVRITARGKKLRIETVVGSFHPRLTKTVAHMFRLDEDLSRFYTLVAEDGELSWSATGAGPHAARPYGVRGRRKGDLHAHTSLGTIADAVTPGRWARPIPLIR